MFLQERQTRSPRVLGLEAVLNLVPKRVLVQLMPLPLMGVSVH